MVKDFPDVFPEELLALPQDQEVEFVIDLIPGTTPIAKRPYRMSVEELEVLNEELRKLLEKKFIRPSASPWGSAVLFVRKKDGLMSLCID